MAFIIAIIYFGIFNNIIIIQKKNREMESGSSAFSIIYATLYLSPRLVSVTHFTQPPRPMLFTI